VRAASGIAVIYALLGILPWLLLAAHMGLRVREPRPLPSGTARADASHVTMVVPARNEARNIVACLETLAAQVYPSFDILVVDDRSEDGTAELARRVGPGNAEGIQVLSGAPLPGGWFGKPWACFQGARQARGELLAFTDADTRHRPELLARAVGGLREDGAAALSPVGRQEMVTLGERLVQPHMFALLGLRYPDLDRPLERDRWRDAILSGQYVLVDRAAYESIGGHEGVKAEVVEDLRLGQEMVRAGHRISLRGAGESFSTRMYHSLGELVEGWTKNVAVGARQAVGRGGRAAVPGMVGFVLAAWVVPPLALGLVGVEALRGGSPSGPLAVWAAGATGVSLLLWAGGYLRLGLPARYAPLYPLGALMAVFIGLRSWLRGTRRIEWKGRTYSSHSTGGASARRSTRGVREGA
jgi:chlorobactene glucosyltransferase